MTATHEYLVVTLTVSVRIPAGQSEADDAAKACAIADEAESALDGALVRLDDWMVAPVMTAIPPL